ncbi:MAG: hypothetical protein ACKV22_02015 [Bryobacteraceae bacterium]
MRFGFTCLVAVLPLAASLPDGNELIRRAAEADRANWRRTSGYDFIERVVTKHLDGNGKVKRTESRAHEVLWLEGSPYRRVIERDGKPLPEVEAKFEADKLKAVTEERRKETPEVRTKRLEEAERVRNRDRPALSEVPQAFHFRVVGEQVVNGRKTWVTAFEPRPGYQPRDRRAKLFPHLKGRVYIDQSEHQWVRTEAELFETFSFGWILVRVAKGSTVVVEQSRTAEGDWTQSSLDVKAEATIGLFKHYRVDQRNSYTGYRRNGIATSQE